MLLIYFIETYVYVIYFRECRNKERQAIIVLRSLNGIRNNRSFRHAFVGTMYEVWSNGTANEE